MWTQSSTLFPHLQQFILSFIWISPIHRQRSQYQVEEADSQHALIDTSVRINRCNNRTY